MKTFIIIKPSTPVDDEGNRADIVMAVHRTEQAARDKLRAWATSYYCPTLYLYESADVNYRKGDYVTDYSNLTFIN